MPELGQDLKSESTCFNFTLFHRFRLHVLVNFVGASEAEAKSGWRHLRKKRLLQPIRWLLPQALQTHLVSYLIRFCLYIFFQQSYTTSHALLFPPKLCNCTVLSECCSNKFCQPMYFIYQYKILMSKRFRNKPEKFGSLSRINHVGGGWPNKQTNK